MNMAKTKSSYTNDQVPVKSITNGMIIGISIAMLSLIVHYLSKTELSDIFFIRGLVFMVSGCMGGVIGVNKKQM